MNKNLNLAILLAAALVLLCLVIYFFRPVHRNITRIAVVGDSQTKISPDTAVITFAVVTQNQQAVTAQQENARKSDAVIKAVQALESNLKPEIKTSDYNLTPEQDYSSDRMPKIIGYEAKNTVTVTTTDLTQVGALIDAATKAGANSVEGISFVVKGDSPAQGKALGMATKQAMAKAEAIAESLGGHVLRVVEMQEAGIPYNPFATKSDNFSSAANSNAMVDFKSRPPTTVLSGSLDVRSQVVLVVEIEIKK